MSRPVTLAVTDRIAVITVDHPPVNALTPDIRSGIASCVSQANADSAVDAIVLIGAGRTFIAGADIRNFGIPGFQPLRLSYDALDASAKPTVAAVHGFALGGGLEHVLACRFRVCSPTAKFGMPEVRLGIVPGGGGTQRLPRLIGVAAALDMICSGRQVTAQEAQDLGIVDAVLGDDADLPAAAIRFARSIVGSTLPPRVRDREDHVADPQQNRALIERARAEASLRYGRSQSVISCIDAVAAATWMPFDSGLDEERRLFSALETSDEAKALRRLFFLERKAAKPPADDVSAQRVGWVWIKGDTGCNLITRSAAPLLAECHLLIAEGAPVADIDSALEQFGFPAGQFMAASGQQDVSPGEMAGIAERLLLVAVDDARMLLQQGKIATADDVDLLWVHGLGFPREKGGLLYWGDRIRS